MSPFLVSAIGVGYEQKTYLWVGYGVWTQLWASLTLPLAWGLSWRAIREGRNFFLATVAVSLTIALHFETGYLAILPLLVWPLVARTSIIIRLRRAALLGFGVFLASAWVIVPLISQRTWAATNELLHGGPLVNGYGAERVLSWLGSGQLLDAGRLPLLTLFAGVGLALACVRWKADETGRALVVAFGACLLLSFGRTTFGVLVDAIPGSSDLFFRRFMMGVQLAGVLFAGIGAAWCGRMAWDAREGAVARLRTRRFELLSGRFATGVVAIAAGVLLLVPAWSQLLAVDRHNATAVGRQSAADKSEGPQVDRLLAIVRRRGDGRVYAGMPSNWGMNFTVGAVPVFKYVEARMSTKLGTRYAPRLS